MTLHTDAELERAVQLLVREQGLSREEVVRLAVLDQARRLEHAGEARASSGRMRKIWNPVLTRLERM